MDTVFLLIVFLPLVGALVAGIIGSKMFRMMGTSIDGGHGAAGALAAHDDDGEEHGRGSAPDWPAYLTSGILLITAVLSWIVFFQVPDSGQVIKVEVARWIYSGTLSTDWALRIDTLTAVMLVVVTTISSLVHVYSIGYMEHDPDRPRFFAYLSLFTFFMLMLVTADNLVQLFFGWEGVGLSSYLLIGFWYKRPSACAAAIKAFVVNRVGDFGFALGIFGTFWTFGSIDFDTIFNAVPSQAGHVIHFLGHDLDVMTVLCLLLFLGAMGKSAQFLLHTWLPDAMEGPTPVSALIHAATMVTAGVFMVARLSPFYEASPDAAMVVTFIGAFTAFFAATIGMVQNDIKRVVAYSTCSQLGYMFAALGVGAYGVGIFHLFTHAFFKALLFLGSGSVIHAMSDEQDMRNMGGLFPHMKMTWLVMLAGTLALTGFPLSSGYFSKDAIIEATYAAHTGIGVFAYIMLVVAAFMTAFYSWRLMFMTFHGRPRATRDVMSHVHESPNVMLIPLYVLAAGALFAGMLFKGMFIGHEEATFWGTSIYRSTHNQVLDAMEHLPSILSWMPTLAMVLGLLLAWLFYIRRPDLPVALAETNEPAYKFLLNKWYFDEIYDFFLVRPAMWLGRFLWKKGDGWLIDGFGPDGVSARVIDVTARVVRLQSGYVYHYAFAMLIGVAALISWYMLGGPH